MSRSLASDLFGAILLIAGSAFALMTPFVLIMLFFDHTFMGLPAPIGAFVQFAILATVTAGAVLLSIANGAMWSWICKAPRKEDVTDVS